MIAVIDGRPIGTFFIDLERIPELCEDGARFIELFEGDLLPEELKVIGVEFLSRHAGLDCAQLEVLDILQLAEVMRQFNTAYREAMVAFVMFEETSGAVN
ncbi:MAG: hypothetical protein SGI88_07770 [Candidatus Hydrogenedentes bacterium]|nr:hypothetical protein [Candidatus Hydrogenedentota bacterium]